MWYIVSIAVTAIITSVCWINKNDALLYEIEELKNDASSYNEDYESFKKETNSLKIKLEELRNHQHKTTDLLRQARINRDKWRNAYKGLVAARGIPSEVEEDEDDTNQ